MGFVDRKPEVGSDQGFGGGFSVTGALGGDERDSEVKLEVGEGREVVSVDRNCVECVVPRVRKVEPGRELLSLLLSCCSSLGRAGRARRNFTQRKRNTGAANMKYTAKFGVICEN